MARSPGDQNLTQAERPPDPEVEDRAVPGHWEGDVLIGAFNRSAIGTLVERRARYVLLFALPAGRSPEHVRGRLAETIQALPEQLRRTLTWDRGKEMAQHLRFTLDTGVQIYFCDPHSPWQRGSNENTNGLPASTSRRAPTCPSTPGGPRRRRRRAQGPSPADPRLAEARRGVRRACCDDGLKPPSRQRTG